MAPVTPSVSVVLATRNRAARLAELLDALREQTVAADRFEVVVVDDNSRDDTPALLTSVQRRNDLRLRSIRLDHDSGPAAARNAGWEAAAAPLVAFTDDDCVPHRGWLEAGLRAAAASPGALIQGRTDPRPDELHRLGPFSRTLRVHQNGPFYQSCNMFYPRELLDRIGGFDAARFTTISGEDVDLAWRSIEAGAPAVFAPDARVFHAVNVLGPIGKLRLAGRWTHAMQAWRHPGLRSSSLVYGVFWKNTHYLLLRAVAGLLIRRRWPLLGDWLAWPYLGHLLQRSSYEGGGGPLLAPYWAIHDVLELVAVVWGAVRYRIPVL